jgi:hypothetical protein
VRSCGAIYLLAALSGKCVGKPGVALPNCLFPVFSESGALSHNAGKKRAADRYDRVGDVVA